jgi:hypothetical protein
MQAATIVDRAFKIKEGPRIKRFRYCPSKAYTTGFYCRKYYKNK